MTARHPLGDIWNRTTLESLWATTGVRDRRIIEIDDVAGEVNAARILGDPITDRSRPWRDVDTPNHDPEID